MRFLTKLFLLLAVITAPTWAQTTATVTATLDLPSGASPSNAKMCFVLVNYGSNTPKVNGVALLIGQKNFCVTADANGAISTALWGNDDITPTNTNWRVDTLYNGILQHSATYSITGASADLNSLQPTTVTATAYTPVAVVTNPTGTQTITQPSGTELDVNTLSTGMWEDCAGKGGADAGAKLLACYNALPAGGGTMDARGILGGTIATDVFSALTGKQATLWWGAGTYAFTLDTTIPANILHVFSQGSVLAPATTKTLTIVGDIQAPNSQIFGGAGTMAFTANRKLLHVIPHWWGAVGDGTADDTAEVLAAINALPGAIGQVGTVLFPCGTYLITSQLSPTADRGNIHLRGESRTCAQLNFSFTGSYGLYIANTTSQNHFSIKNLSFRGGLVAGQPSIAALRFDRIFQVVFDDLKIFDAPTQIRLFTSGNISGSNWVLNANNNTWTSAIDLDSVSGLNLKGINWEGNAGSTGVLIRTLNSASTNVHVSGFTSVGESGQFVNTGSGGLQRATFTGNTISGIATTTNAFACGGGATACDDVIVSDNVFQAVSSTGTACINAASNAANFKEYGNRCVNYTLPFTKHSSATLSSLSSPRIGSTGTALVAGDFALHANWGAGAAVSAVTGTDQGWQITVTAAGTPGASPTIVLTFKDGTWTNAPICQSKQVGGTGARSDIDDVPAATTWTMTWIGTPVAASTYIISGICMGR